MSKSKQKSYYALDRDYWDGAEADLRRVREEKNRKKEKRVQHALKTKNVRELLELEEDEDEWENQYRQ